MRRELFAVTTFCLVHNLDYSFIASLREEGLITITTENDGEYIEEEELHNLELYTRWHHEMGINPAGIDAVRNLLDKIRDMQNELNLLKNKLREQEMDEE